MMLEPSKSLVIYCTNVLFSIYGNFECTLFLLEIYGYCVNHYSGIF